MAALLDALEALRARRVAAARDATRGQPPSPHYSSTWKTTIALSCPDLQFSQRRRLAALSSLPGWLRCGKGYVRPGWPILETLQPGPLTLRATGLTGRRSRWRSSWQCGVPLPPCPFVSLAAILSPFLPVLALSPLPCLNEALGSSQQAGVGPLRGQRRRQRAHILGAAASQKLRE